VIETRANIERENDMGGMTGLSIGVSGLK